MKSLFFALIIATTLASCGKDNKVSSGASSVFNPITTSVQGAADLGSKIDNYTTQFGVGNITYYGQPQTWGTLANTGLNLAYRYTKSTSTSTGSNCEKKWGIFYVCSSTSTSSSSSVVESRKVFNNTVDVTSKANELKDIINRANPLIPIALSGTSHMITTTDGKRYVIDTRYPLQANPIGVMDSTGTEYLYNITEN